MQQINSLKNDFADVNIATVILQFFNPNEDSTIEFQNQI